MLYVRLLGTFEASFAGEPVLGLHAREGERLLAYLALHRGRTLSVSAVAETIWPDTGSLDSLHQSVRSLRASLGPAAACLETAKGTLRLALERAEVDTAAFERQARTGLESRDAQALRRAASLYAGPLLEEWAEPWVEAKREGLQERYAETLECLAALEAEAGNHSAASRCLRLYLRLHGTEERVWLALVRELVQAGERLDALRVYEKYRDFLQRRAPGLEPSLEMTELYRRLREGTLTVKPLDSDPSLASLPEPVGGAVPLESPFYLARSADALALAAVERRDSLILVKGPHQTGKSSLLARVLERARHLGALTLVTDFAELPAADLSSMEVLCRCLVAQVAAQLDPPADPAATWLPGLPPGTNLERFLHRHVLGSLSAPVVWAMDEIDRLYGLPSAEEFFSLLRAWHEKRSLEPARPWRRLTLALACATEAHLLIRDLNKSPFNVGTRVELGDFTPEQTADLDRRHGGPLAASGVLAAFWELTGGHPYLVRRGLQEVAAGADPEALLADAASEAGPFGDPLRRLLRGLRADAGLCEALRAVLSGRPCPEADFFPLRAAGVLCGSSAEGARLRCGLYATYLAHHL